jgi:hypothetical protein
MMNKTLERLYARADIDSAPSKGGGSKSGKLGHVYERYLDALLTHDDPAHQPDRQELLTQLDILEITSIQKLQVPSLPNGGAPKTDVAYNINGKTYRFSVKASKANQVSAAEFKVDDIIKGVNITDPLAEGLIRKFAATGSQRLLSKDDKAYLVNYFDGTKGEDLRRWVLTGTINNSSLHVGHPNYFVHFKLSEHLLKSFSVHTQAAVTCPAKLKKTFKTNLGWTRPSKNKPNVIQFKTAVL